MNATRLLHFVRLSMLALLTLALGRAWAATTIPLKYPGGVALDSKGNLYVGNSGSNQVLVYSAAYVQQPKKTISAGLSTPLGVAFDSQGNLYVANFLAYNVTEYNPAGLLMATLSNNVFLPRGVAVDGLDNLWVNNSHGWVTMFSPVGVYLGISDPGLYLSGIAAHGAWYVLGSSDRFTEYPAGEVLTNNGVAGSWNYGSNAVDAVAFDIKGQLYVAQSSGEVDMVNPYTHVSTELLPAGSLPEEAISLAVDATRERIYICFQNSSQIQVYSTTTKQLLTTIH